MIKNAIMAVAMLLSVTNPALPEDLKEASSTSTEQKAAELTVRRYMDLLHVSDTKGIMELYDEDSVFLPAGGPTMVGKEKIRQNYVAMFKIMSIPEGVSTLEEATIHGDIAVVRLATKAAVLIKASQEKSALNAREMFVLKKVEGGYKISRYMFNTVN